MTLRDRIQAVVIDTWAGLSHKAPMTTKPGEKFRQRVDGWTPASWTGDRNQRRLTAYMILAAYDQNSSRHFVQGNSDDRDERREYGDASLVIDTVMSAVLGDEQQVTVAGAENYDPDLEEPTPPEPEADPDNPDAAPGEVTEEQEAEFQEALEAWAENNAAAALADRQEFLQDWATAVHLPLRMVDCERNVVGLGDGIYLLGWDDQRARPSCAVMDPGFYFPVLPDSLDAYEYPTRVHFAWELPGEDFPDGKDRVRRITYEIKPLHDVEDSEALLAARTDEEIDAAIQVPQDTRIETRDDGFGGTMQVYTRQYPWDENGDRSEVACYRTDATWIVDDLKDVTDPNDFDALLAEADEIRARDEDQLIDFIPVVHVPHTPPGGEHFGQSALMKVVQVLDDLQNSDTDAQAASATTGSPIIGVSGSKTGGDDPLTGQRGEPRTVKPGQVWGLGENGRLDVAATHEQLAELRNYVKDLRDRLATNSRLPGSLLGTTPPEELSSGFHMQLTFGPLSSMVRTARLVRSVKYPLLLKMVQRLYQANGVLDAGETPDAEIQFGSFLPADMAGTLELVTKGITASAMSVETGVTMLLEVGFPIDDVAEEIARIQSRSFEQAMQLRTATNDDDAVREYLGLDPRDPDATSQEAPLVQMIDGQPVIVPRGQPVAGGTGVGVPSPSDSGAGGAG